MSHPLDAIDLFLARRGSNRLTADREVVDIAATTGGDVRTSTGYTNLRQALINRLLTRQGELARLGHPDYGSRLHQLIGEVNNERTRLLAEVFIREALGQEERVAEIREIAFALPSRGEQRSTLAITVAVAPVDSTELIVLALTLNLEG